MALKKPEPLNLVEWSEENFYLSAESSYVEGNWETIPYQRAPMMCISNDDIREITFIKSARVGYTKMIVAAMGYFAEHKKRNQVVFQPVDQDATDFVKDEIDPILRDVPCLMSIFPDYGKKSKNNTLNKKVFIGSVLDIRGGKAGKNYRRLSKDVVYYDELDGFDADVENEGDPVTLGDKRIEGATFPKSIRGSTPKIKGESLTEHYAEAADHLFRFEVPCPHCGNQQVLKWGGKDCAHGIKWLEGTPETASYLCEKCTTLIDYSALPEMLEAGRWVSDQDRTWIDAEGFFRSESGEVIDTPRSVAFHIWTAYSVFTTWVDIVRDFLKAKGDRSKLKTFVNTTLGETWDEDEGEKVDHSALMARAEHYRAEVPVNNCVLVASVDVQDDRLEYKVKAWQRGEENYAVEYGRLYGDLSRSEIWDQLAFRLKRQFQTPGGGLLDVRIVMIDSGGHFTDEVYGFSKRHGLRWAIPLKGASVAGKPVVNFPRKRNAKGVYLTMVGTDTAKEIISVRWKTLKPGPGYFHTPVNDQFDESYYKQLTAERKVAKWRNGRRVIVWDAGKRRNEAFDLDVYNLAGIRLLQQHMGVSLDFIFDPSDDTEGAEESQQSAVPVSNPAPKRAAKRPRRRQSFLS